MASSDLSTKRFSWELPATTVSQLQGNAFQQLLSSIVAHTLRVGLQLAAGLQQNLTFSTDIPTNSEAHERTLKYLAIATLTSKTDGTNTVSRDKFFPLRRTSPSMKFIFERLTLSGPLSTSFIFQLALLRVFGFGSLKCMDTLLKNFDPQASIDSQIKILYDVISTWISAGTVNAKGKQNAGKMGKPVYGQLMISRDHVQNMLKLLNTFAIRILQSNSGAATPMPFTGAYQLLSSLKIPSVKGGGIIAWLFICDLAEYGIVDFPLLDDLAFHIAKQEKSTKPLGPLSALIEITKWMNVDCPRNKVALLALLTVVWNNITNQNSNLPDIQYLQAECARVQGRNLNVIDLEHVLCKISRQINKTGMSDKERKPRKPKAAVAVTANDNNAGSNTNIRAEGYAEGYAKGFAEGLAKALAKRPAEEAFKEESEDSDDDDEESGESEGSETDDEEAKSPPMKKAKKGGEEDAIVDENKQSDHAQENQVVMIGGHLAGTAVDQNHTMDGLGKEVTNTEEDAEGEDFDDEAEFAFYGFRTVA